MRAVTSKRSTIFNISTQKTHLLEEVSNVLISQASSEAYKKVNGNPKQMWKSNFFTLWSLLRFVRLFPYVFNILLLIERPTQSVQQDLGISPADFIELAFFHVVAMVSLTFFTLLKAFQMPFTGNSQILLQSMIFKHSHQHPLCC